MLSHPRHGPGRRDDLIEAERAQDGTLRLRGEPLRAAPATLNELLDAAAARAPDRPFLIERDARDVWRELTFARAAEASLRIGAALRALGGSASRPLLILSGNGIDHALMTFGALRAGIPVIPLAPTTGRAAHDDEERLRDIARQVRPGVVFARDGAAYAAASRTLAPGARLVTVAEPPRGVDAVDFAALTRHAPLGAGDVAVDGETIAKVLFTARAPGEAKGVVQTHAMIGAMLEGIAQTWTFLDDRPPVIVDRFPWSRSFGGNTVLGIALRHAGTLYVDDGGASSPERFERSVRLRSTISPTLAFDVPLGWSTWVERLRGDDALRARWQSRLDVACWTGATLAPAIRDVLRAMGVPLASAWGMTETLVASLTRDGDPPSDAIGVPLPGVELKLVPCGVLKRGATGDRFEARVRGAQVTSGYWWRNDLTATAFDDEGFARTGDLVRPLDAHVPELGLAYTGRIDERFKLSSGTWVRAGELRERFLAACPDAAQAVISGAGRDAAGVIVWPRAGTLLDRRMLRAEIADAMRSLTVNDRAAGRLRRALIVDEPLSAERAAARAADALAVEQWLALTARLHASEPDAEVIVL